MTAIAILLALALPVSQVAPEAPGEEPDALATARADLAERLSIDPEAIDAEAMWPVVWPNAALGVPEPDMMYAQVLMPGQVVLLRIGEEIFEYHSADQGNVVYAGPYTEPLKVPASVLVDSPGEATEGRVAVEGMLVRDGDRALLYDELVDCDALPEDVTPVLVVGIALQPFIERRWETTENACAWVRLTGRLEVREPGEPGAGWGRQGDLFARIRSERIQVLSDRGRAPGVFSYAELVAQARALDQMIVTVQGELTTGFETSALGPLDATDDDDELPATWVEGSLDGLPRPAGGGARELVKVEITGLLESRTRGGYGHLGGYALRLTADAAFALSTVLDYPTLVEHSDELKGELVTVCGRLLLGEGRSDLLPLLASSGEGEELGCLVAGDLAGLAEMTEEAPEDGVPVQVHGRLLVAEDGEGFGRNGTRLMKLESVVARALTDAELERLAPTQPDRGEAPADL